MSSNSSASKTQVLRNLVSNVDQLFKLLGDETQRINGIYDWKTNVATPTFSDVKSMNAMINFTIYLTNLMIDAIETEVSKLYTNISNMQSIVEQKLVEANQFISTTDKYSRNISAWLQEHIGTENEVINKAIEKEVESQLNAFLQEMKTREESLWNIFKTKSDAMCNDFEKFKEELESENKLLLSRVSMMEEQTNRARDMQKDAEEKLSIREREYREAIEEVRKLPREEAELFQKLMKLVEEERKGLAGERQNLEHDRALCTQEMEKFQQQRQLMEQERQEFINERKRIEESKSKLMEECEALKSLVMENIENVKTSFDIEKARLEQEVEKNSDLRAKTKETRKKSESQNLIIEERLIQIADVNEKVKESLLNANLTRVDFEKVRDEILKTKELLDAEINLIAIEKSSLEVLKKDIATESNDLQDILSQSRNELELLQKNRELLEEKSKMLEVGQRKLEEDAKSLGEEINIYKDYGKQFQDDLLALKEAKVVLERFSERENEKAKERDYKYAPVLKDEISTSIAQGSLMTASEWLYELGLEEYTEKFEANGLTNIKLCSVIDADDLDSLGITDEAHRDKILKEAPNLRFI